MWTPEQEKSRKIISDMDRQLLLYGFTQEDLDRIHFKAAEQTVPYGDNPGLPEAIRVSHIVHPYFTEAAKAVKEKGLFVHHGIVGSRAWFDIFSPSSYRDLIKAAGYQSHVLTLRRRWFDMILDGDKIEEYRDDSPYWQTRLLDTWQDDGKNMRVVFRNGYSQNSPAFIADVTASRRTGGFPEWGAEPGKPYIVLKINRILIAENGRLRSVG
jgi:hypothetical protein